MKLLAIKYLLLAQSMSRGIAFWVQTFGLDLRVEGDFWSELGWGNTTLALHGGGDGSRNTTDLSLQVDNIVKACRLICENGGKIMQEPFKEPQESLVKAVFQDTEGNEVMLTQWVG